MANEEIDFNKTETTTEDDGLSPDAFNKGNFLKNPGVGSEIIFTVLKVNENKNIDGKSKEGVSFKVGLKKKDGSYRRYDIETDMGTYTVSSWEIYFKLFGKEGVLMEHSKTHNNKFAGAKISIKKLLDGGHASLKIVDLMKVLNTTQEEAVKYQEKIKTAIKEQRLYEVTLVVV